MYIVKFVYFDKLVDLRELSSLSDKITDTPMVVSSIGSKKVPLHFRACVLSVTLHLSKILLS